MLPRCPASNLQEERFCLYGL